ncbi:MAG: Alcohol dehydrogenase zinc-binding domain protein [Sporomusa sp.]|jgi:threonine dehydrogenase-like Zn-dependent dehydrogenase|nr:Alcohol dehydrogenase zinc-binding domain protein [Sporomusa sp.]
MAKAMVMEAFRKELILKEFPEVELVEGEVVIRMEAAGVCGSDVHMWEGNDPRIPLPTVLGHEGVGTIVQLCGKRTTVMGEELNIGDRVIWNRGVTCGHCSFCVNKREPSLCPHRWTYGINVNCQDGRVRGCYTDELVLTKDTDIFIVPKTIDPAVLVTAGCSGATIAHAFELGRPEQGDTVLIQGPGPLGIYSVAFAKAAGAKEIIVIGGTEDRLEMARAFGATITLNRNQLTEKQRKDAVLAATNGLGADVAIEAAGQPGAVSEGIGLVRNGGAYLMAGFGDPNGSVTLDCFHDIARKNIRIQGVWVSDTKHTYQALNLVLGNPDLFAKLVSHRLPLEQANEALELMAKKQATKIVLMPN